MKNQEMFTMENLERPFSPLSFLATSSLFLGSMTFLMSSLASASATLKDVVVPVPAPVRVPASGLTLAGSPGDEQGTTFSVEPVRLASDGHIISSTLSGCLGNDYDNCGTTGQLGQEVVLRDGKYLVRYSGSTTFVDIKVGEHQVIHLQQISIPKIDGNYRIQIFLDTTNSQVQDQVLRLKWLTEDPLSSVADFSVNWDDADGGGPLCILKTSFATGCRNNNSGSSTANRYCSAWEGKDYRKLLNAEIKFDAKGLPTLSDLYMIPSGTAFNCGSVGYEMTTKNRSADLFYIGSTDYQVWRDGAKISVLPGVYGIKTTNIDDQSNYQYGVVLNDESSGQ